LATPSLLSVVRAILTAEPTLTVSDIVPKVKKKGLTVTDMAVKKAYHNAKAGMRAATPKVVPAAARETPAPAPAVSSPGLTLTAMLANVALVNAVIEAAGGVEQARQVAEAVRSCGSVDEFLQHLDLVAGIRSA
jgi:hypothetical protein